jgi:hypothetical protein
MHARAKVTTDGAGPGDKKLHFFAPA